MGWGAKFIMPKCFSSTDKHGKDNLLSIGTGIGSILAACLLVAAGICAYRSFQIGQGMREYLLGRV